MPLYPGFYEILHGTKQFCGGCIKIVVNDYPVELGSKAQFETGFADAFLQAVDSFGAAFVQPFAQHIERWRLYKNRERGIRICILYSKRTLYINVYQGYALRVPDAFELRFEGAVIFAGIYHLPFYKSIVIYQRFELVFGIEIIVFAISLATARLAGAGRDRKSQFRARTEQAFYQRRFSRSRRGCNYYDLTF